MDAQMKKGVLEMCLLYQLSQHDYYGYHLMQILKQHFPEVNDSSFYVILRRLHKEGLTELYYGDDSGGPKRKYYQITEKGKVYLNQSVSDWKEIKLRVKNLGIN